MAPALPRKIKLAFIVQALVASLAMVLAVVLAASSIRQSLVRERLREEADAAWQHIAAGRIAALPRSHRLEAYFTPAHGSAPTSPDGAPAIAPGLHVPLWRDEATLVERRAAGTLSLVFTPSVLDRAIAWTAGLSLLIALLITSLASWLTYRTSKRMVGPVSWLAGVVAQWDPRKPNANALEPHNLPVDSGPEVRRLARALNGLAGRIGGYIDRERHFTRDASHELRTPLTVIRVASDIMAADPELPPRLKRSVGRMQRAGHDMQGVIDAFFILARDVEVEAETERFDVHEVVDAEVESVQPLLAGKPVELRVVDEGGGVIDAPRRVVALMLGNLLSNAVRFTERGHVEVVMRPDRLEVRDTGIGMSPEALAKAFDPFYREDRDKEQGMGIGLSIVHRLGERFGWPVELASTLGEGTVATIRLRA